MPNIMENTIRIVVTSDPPTTTKSQVSVIYMSAEGVKATQLPAKS